MHTGRRKLWRGLVGLVGVWSGAEVRDVERAFLAIHGAGRFLGLCLDLVGRRLKGTRHLRPPSGGLQLQLRGCGDVGGW